MENFITSIPGPIFLTIFSCIAAILVIVGYRLVDNSTDYPLPEPVQFDYISIAALRGGWQAVIRAVVFRFWQQGLIEIQQTDKNAIIKTIEESKEKLEEVEKEIYSFLAKEQQSEALFSNYSLKRTIQSNLVSRYNELERHNLLKSPEDKMHSWLITLVFITFIIGLGVGKLYLGIIRDKPVLYLLLLMVIFIILSIVILKPYTRATRLGKRYLKKLEEDFSWLKNDLINGKTPEGINPNIAVAIFGIGFLDQSLMYGSFNQAFQKSRASYQGGCSGGCGVYSSGDGGGGSGDGGCSGGCGGCGGGD